jgi:hypothetical protein
MTTTISISERKSMPNIRLHPKYGVNPTIPTCFYCLEPKDEVALLGAASKRITGQDEAPMHGPVFDKEPCSQCAEWMERGIILIGVDEEKSTDMEKPWRTGSMVVVSDDWVRRTIHPAELRDGILRRRATFVVNEIVSKLLEANKKLEQED